MLRVAVPTYYLALTAGNFALLSFAYGRIWAPVAAPLKQKAKGRIGARVQGLKESFHEVNWSKGMRKIRFAL